MSEKKTTEQKTITLEMDSADIFITQNAKHRSYIEQFSFSGINFTQKHLGTLCGFFLIRDKSSWSSHIVHFLTAEIKKEYFAMPRRTLSKSFEASLHHVNRALAELAKNDNIDWIGMLDSAVCAYDKTSIHFSVTGNAHILLLRDGELIMISEGLTSEQASHNPLKTFVDTASGKVRAGDKIIITSQELLDLVPFDELEKNALSFSKDDFVQFITTVLTNECEMASTHILDVREHVVATNLEALKEHEDNIDVPLPSNAFSASTYTAPKTAPVPRFTEETTDTKDNTLEDEYVDKRTGHIYLKGNDEHVAQKKSLLAPFLDHAKDFASDASYSTKKHLSKTRKKSFAALSEIPQSARGAFEKFFTEPIEEEIGEPQSEKDIEAKPKPQPQKKEVSQPQSRPQPQQRPAPQKATQKPSQPQNDEDRMNASIEAFMLRSEETTSHDEATPSSSLSFRTMITSILLAAKNGVITLCQIIFEIIKKPSTLIAHRGIRKALPSPRRIINLWQSMNIKLRLTIIGMLCAMIFVPLLLMRSDSDEDVSEPTPAVEEVPQEQVATTPEITNTVADPATIRDNIDAITVSKIADDYIVATPSSLIITDGDTTQDVSLPENIGKIVFATAMPRINTLFFITDEDLIYSFAPATQKFTKQTIVGTLNHNNILAISTYETYLYITTPNNITRYARTDTGGEEGFNAPKGRLTDESTLTEVDAMSIDDNVHLTHNDKLYIIQDDQQQEQSLPDDVKAQLIFTTTDTTYLWLLDTGTGTLYALNKTTLAVEQEVTHLVFTSVVAFTVDETTKQVLATTSDTLLRFTLE